MPDQTCWESFKVEGATLVEKLKALLHAGNVRRVVVEHKGKTIAEFPLTVGVVGAVLAPLVAAIGAIVALLEDCTIHVERQRVETDAAASSKAGEGTGQTRAS